MTSKTRAAILTTLFFTLAFALCWYVFYGELLLQDFSSTDLSAYVIHASRFKDPGVHFTHPLFQILTYYFATWTGMSFTHAVISLCALAFVLYGVLIDRVLRSRLGYRVSTDLTLALTAVALLVSAIYVPPFSANIYLGQGSPNIWHNPTIILVKPFAIVCTLLLTGFFKRPERQRQVGYDALLAGLTLLSLLAKPNFIMVLLPASILFILLRYPRRQDLYWKTALLFLPGLLLLCFQYLKAYQTTGAGTAAEQDKIILDCFGAWRVYTKSVCVSILLALGFPITLALLRFRRVYGNDNLLLAWLMTLAGIAQNGFLAEKLKYNHGNFGWGYLTAMSLLFVFSIEELLYWWRGPDKINRWGRARLACCAFVLSLHLVSGIYYFYRIATQKGYY